MTQRVHRSRVAYLATLALLAMTPALFASDLVNFTTVANTDFAFFGAGGMRGAGTGNITVTGVTGTVTTAFLYWHGPTNDTGDANAAVTFNGTPITGTNIGNSADNCWGFQNSKAYVANVTSLVSGDATYTLANFRKTVPVTADINGVALVVFFNDGNAANNRDYVIFHGNDSNITNTFDAAGWNATLAGITYTSGTASMRMIVADGQAFADDEFRINGVTLLPSGGANWEGNTVPDQGTAANTNGGLWDHRTFDVTSLFTPGPNTLTIQPTTYVNDCLAMVAAIFDLPGGAAPPTPTGGAPTPGGPAPPAIVPTLSGTALVIMAAILAIVGLLALKFTRSS
jgi:Protein of unknown function (DUF3344)